MGGRHGRGGERDEAGVEHICVVARLVVTIVVAGVTHAPQVEVAWRVEMEDEETSREAEHEDAAVGGVVGGLLAHVKMRDGATRPTRGAKRWPALRSVRLPDKSHPDEEGVEQAGNGIGFATMRVDVGRRCQSVRSAALLTTVTTTTAVVLGPRAFRCRRNWSGRELRTETFSTLNGDVTAPTSCVRWVLIIIVALLLLLVFLSTVCSNKFRTKSAAATTTTTTTTTCAADLVRLLHRLLLSFAVSVRDALRGGCAGAGSGGGGWDCRRRLQVVPVGETRVPVEDGATSEIDGDGCPVVASEVNGQKQEGTFRGQR